MATLLAHITVREGCEREFEEIARSLFAATHAHEHGVIHYEYWRGAQPRTYYTLLAFDDHQAFIRHQTSDHHEVASPALGTLIEGLSLEWVDPVAGASPLGATETQACPADADELTRLYTDRFAAQVADWWSDQRR